MLLRTHNHGWTSLIYAAEGGHLDALRLLLNHPSADPAAMLAFDSAASDGHGYSALIGAASGAAYFAIHCTYGPGVGPGAHASSPARPFAPLLFLLRRVAADPQPGDAQQAHMTKVMEILGGRNEAYSEESEDEEECETLLSDDQPDTARDECVRQLLSSSVPRALTWRTTSPL
jgi:hypothetical protein